MRFAKKKKTNKQTCTILCAETQLDALAALVVASGRLLSQPLDICDRLASIDLRVRTGAGAGSRAHSGASNVTVGVTVRRLGALILILPQSPPSSSLSSSGSDDSFFSIVARNSVEWTAFTAYLAFMHHAKLLRREQPER